MGAFLNTKMISAENDPLLWNDRKNKFYKIDMGKYAIGVSSNSIYLLIMQLMYVGWLDVGLALFQDSQYSYCFFTWICNS